MADPQFAIGDRVFVLHGRFQGYYGRIEECWGKSVRVRLSNQMSVWYSGTEIRLAERS